ncbi:MAG TPA: cupin-like domain-containing protein [Candidatus Dormibacteraeota bacterium]|jgi:hypothetical protein
MPTSTTEVPRLRLDEAAAAAVTGRPCIVGGRLDGRLKWDLKRIADAVGHLRVTAWTSPTGRFLPDPETGFTTRAMTLAQFHQWLTEREPAEHLCIASINVARLRVPRALSHLAPAIRSAMALPARSPAPVELWIGRAGTVVPLHYELPSSWLLPAAGELLVTLAPPSAADRLATYPADSPWANYSGVEPDRLDGAGWHTAALAPGDALCIPALWWRSVRATGTAITVSRSFLLPALAASPAALGRAMAMEGLFGRPERMTEFLDFDGVRRTPRWLPERLWASGEHALAAVAAGSTLEAALRRGGQGGNAADVRRAQELVALARRWRAAAAAPPADELEPLVAEMLTLAAGLGVIV